MSCQPPGSGLSSEISSQIFLLLFRLFSFPFQPSSYSFSALFSSSTHKFFFQILNRWIQELQSQAVVSLLTKWKSHDFHLLLHTVAISVWGTFLWLHWVLWQYPQVLPLPGQLILSEVTPSKLLSLTCCQPLSIFCGFTPTYFYYTIFSISFQISHIF